MVDKLDIATIALLGLGAYFLYSKTSKIIAPVSDFTKKIIDGAGSIPKYSPSPEDLENFPVIVQEAVKATTPLTTYETFSPYFPPTAAYNAIAPLFSEETPTWGDTAKKLYALSPMGVGSWIGSTVGDWTKSLWS